MDTKALHKISYGLYVVGASGKEGGQLNAKQRHATFQELSEKCRIYGNGCLKRGRVTEGNYYLNLPESITI